MSRRHIPGQNPARPFHRPRCKHRRHSLRDKQPEQRPWRALLLAAHWKLPNRRIVRRLGVFFTETALPASVNDCAVFHTLLVGSDLGYRSGGLLPPTPTSSANAWLISSLDHSRLCTRRSAARTVSEGRLKAPLSVAPSLLQPDFLLGPEGCGGIAGRNP
jgi:hypothetical protein